MMTNNAFTLYLRSQVFDHDTTGHAYWQVEEKTKTLAASRSAIIVCDMWDRHWSRGASERVEMMVPRMDSVLKTARSKDAHIIHAPSDTMTFYEDSPARRRMREYPVIKLPPEIEHTNLPLPVDASDHGSDTGETETHSAWRRQHPGIEIDDTQDGVTDNGGEVYSLLATEKVEQVLIMGVHTNMCVLNRSFAIMQMVRWGVDIALVRDLTDAMYNPALPPYVSHDEGTALVIAYIEKFWCPSIESVDLV